MEEIAIFWFRRDMRLEDNHGLLRALQSGYPVLALFIFDRAILDKLDEKRDARVLFIHQEVLALKAQLEEMGSSMLLQYGEPGEVWQKLLETYPIKAVYANRDYEPYARERDQAVYHLLQDRQVPFKGYKDQVLLEKNEVCKADGQPYTVYTPYMRKYKSLLDKKHLESFPSEKYRAAFWRTEALPDIELAEMGFESFAFDFPARHFDLERIEKYHHTRDIPGQRGTTRLSLHLRFGTVSIRALAKVAQNHNEKFFNELIWRDFYQSILYHFPDSLQRSFRPEYDAIRWENNEEHFERWCAGKTGYALVDAGMRELNTTGFMHNRMRMLTASFLTKHLLIDWRWGEAYFAKKLLDYEAASNVGGWQWAAGSGVDAAPYFRIFSPMRQQERFDADYTYVKRWVPEYGTERYPTPVVEHKAARERALARYKEGLGKG